MTNLVISNQKKSRISPEIYGHFSEHLGRCIYDGLFVGKNSDIPNVNGMRTDVVNALKGIDIPVLRWPGGCFADEYHWQDGIGALEQRKKMVNTHWGGVTEDNSFGTHEFMELCEQLGCEPYINGNVGSGTVAEMADWVEYMTHPGGSTMSALRQANGREKPWSLKYFGVGNENWGCGGNMRPEYYADEYRRYQTYVRNYGDNKIYKIACGAPDDRYDWTETVMRNAHNYMHGLTLHYYVFPGGGFFSKGSATDFNLPTWYRTLDLALRMDTLVERHSGIMDIFDPEKRVGLLVDEWGAWYDVEPGTNPGFLYQQNTMRDALVAGITLNIFNHHSDRVVMANLAQTVNVLQAVILTQGNKMVLTPTYHVFDLYKEHQGNTLLGSNITTGTVGPDGNNVPTIHHSASVSADGVITVTLCNLSAENSETVHATIADLPFAKIAGRIVTGGMKDYNDFDEPNVVAPAVYEGATKTDTGFTATLPPCSVVALTLI